MWVSGQCLPSAGSKYAEDGHVRLQSAAGGSSLVECLLGMCEALCTIPSTAHQKFKIKPEADSVLVLEILARNWSWAAAYLSPFATWLHGLSHSFIGLS